MDPEAPRHHPISLLVTSRHEENGLTVDDSVQRHEAQLTRVGAATYLRFQAEELSTTLRVGEGELRLRRQGSLDHWQSHRAGEWTGGSLDLGGGAMLLRVHTHRCDWTELGPEEGHLQLAYDLYALPPGGDGTDDGPADPLGAFTLTMAWQPQVPAESH